MAPYMLHCTINVKRICCSAQFGKCQASSVPPHTNRAPAWSPSASSLRAVPHQRSQGIGRTPLRGRINKERNKVGSSRKAGSRGTRDRQARNKREAEEDSRYRQAGSMRRALDRYSRDTNVVASQPPRRWTLTERQGRLLLSTELPWRSLAPCTLHLQPR